MIGCWFEVTKCKCRLRRLSCPKYQRSTCTIKFPRVLVVGEGGGGVARQQGAEEVRDPWQEGREEAGHTAASRALLAVMNSGGPCALITAGRGAAHLHAATLAPPPPHR
ncbi:hypothetical protein E2C01_076224 [Portunus trituberculatus]|uniref:Uncharacterized protein n=1 Tax=Portunus trituberculatus TaxID=210409 RepID=A0A5B7IID4_PORTR|nr:hypothetical protein [Portunus trituberculatus]